MRSRGQAPPALPPATPAFRPRRPGLPREAGMPRRGHHGTGGPIRPGGPLATSRSPPTSLRQARTRQPRAAEPDGMRAVPATPPRAAAGQEPRGQPGPAGPAEASGQFDGGYAYVIRASDNPVRPARPARPPSFGRPADPARPAESRPPGHPGGEAPADVYVYRDTDGQPDDPAAAAPGPGENDAAYWYDLPGTGAAGRCRPRSVPEETRGPFEPLVSSADPPDDAPLLRQPRRRRTRPAGRRSLRRGAGAAADDGLRTRRTPTRASSSRSRTCT